MAEQEIVQEVETPKEEELIDEEAVEKAPGDDEKGPVPYERFKEVNDSLRDFKKLGGTPAQIAEALSRLQIYQNMANFEEEDEPVKPKTDEERTDAAQKERAKELILELFPGLQKLDQAVGLTELYYKSMESEAWNTVEGILSEEGEDPSREDVIAMGGMLADVVKADPKLRAKYNTGRVEDAVRAAHKKLMKRFGKAAPKAVDDRSSRIKDKRKLAELPKKVTPGGKPTAPAEDDKGPASIAEAGKSAEAKLAALFGD